MYGKKNMSNDTKKGQQSIESRKLKKTINIPYCLPPNNIKKKWRKRCFASMNLSFSFWTIIIWNISLLPVLFWSPSHLMSIIDLKENHNWAKIWNWKLVYLKVSQKCVGENQYWASHTVLPQSEIRNNLLNKIERFTVA